MRKNNQMQLSNDLKNQFVNIRTHCMHKISTIFICVMSDVRAEKRNFFS